MLKKKGAQRMKSCFQLHIFSLKPPSFDVCQTREAEFQDGVKMRVNDAHTPADCSHGLSKAHLMLSAPLITHRG